MELLYLWIDDFRSIKQQGFNFGGEYVFNFNPKSGELFCEENSLFIEDFYGSKVKNVTAIVGKNGSGKSTFIDFIKLNISYDIGVTNLSYLCLFREKNKNEIFIYNSTRKKITLPKGRKSLFISTDRGMFMGKLISLLYPTAFIFYSPIIDLNYYTEIVPFDISTTSLIKDIKLSAQTDSSKVIDRLIHEEVKKQLQFVAEYRNILPFELPEELLMNPNPIDEGVITSKIDLTKDSFISQLNKYRKIIEKETYNKRGEMEQNYVEIYSSLFWHTINYILNSDSKQELSSLIKDNPFKSTTDNPSWELLEYLYTAKQLSSLPSWKVVNVFLDRLKSMEDNEMYYFYARFNFEIKSIENFDAIDEFLDLYYQLARVGDFLRFNWPGLSSGQQSLLAMFSRFYGLRSEIKSFSERKSDNRVNVHNMTPFTDVPDAIVMLDEGESHLHPQWQKEFVHTITEYLPDIIGVPQIQIILATNSPFLISDLPHYNVIFLEQDQKKEKTIVTNSVSTTFAANIHELLAQSFFLDSTIGKVAENKINMIIQLLNSDQELSLNKHEEIEKIIKLIDDSFVQDKLIQMLSLKMEINNWDEYMLEQQKKLINEKLGRIRKNKGNA